MLDSKPYTEEVPRENAAVPGEQSLTARNVVGILLRRYVTILLVIALVTCPAVAYSLLTGARYTATASVMLDPPTGSLQRPTMTSVIDTQRDIIRSGWFIETTMADLGLYDVGAYRVEPEDSTSLRGRLRTWANQVQKQWFNDVALPEEGSSSASRTGDDADADAGARELAENTFAQDLEVRQAGESLVLHVSFTSIDPELSARVANYLVELYLDRQLAYKQAAAERAETWLTERVAEMREEVLEAERQLASFRARYQLSLDDTLARSSSAVLYQELERQASAKRAAYQAILGRYYDSRGHIESLSPEARIVARAAIPTKPSSPSPFLIFGVTLVTSGIFGCSIALLREQMDRRIHSGRQIETALRLPCLAVLPKVPVRSRRTRDQDALATEPCSPYSQAIRTLSLRLATAGHRNKVLCISAPSPDGSTSSVAAGIAVALRQTCEGRVLLVDLELGNSSIAERFDISAERPGVVTLLTHPDFVRNMAPKAAEEVGGEGLTVTALQKLIVPHAATGVDVLPSGAKDHPGSGLTLRGVSKVLNVLRPRYDFIVIDGPPLVGGADGGLVALHADATLLVARVGHTTIDAAAASLVLLRDIGAHVLGMALATGGEKPTRSVRGSGSGDNMEYEDLRRHICPRGVPEQQEVIGPA